MFLRAPMRLLREGPVTRKRRAWQTIAPGMPDWGGVGKFALEQFALLGLVFPLGGFEDAGIDPGNIGPFALKQFGQG